MFLWFLDISSMLLCHFKLFFERLENVLFIINMLHLVLEKDKTGCCVIVRTAGATSRLISIQVASVENKLKTGGHELYNCRGILPSSK